MSSNSDVGPPVIARRSGADIAAYRETARLDPKNAEVHNGLAWLPATVPGVRDGKQVAFDEVWRIIRGEEPPRLNGTSRFSLRWPTGLRDEDEARQWFEKGAQWMVANNANDETMIRLRSDAAKLLDGNEAK